MALQTRQIYRFGRFRLDATAKVVLKDGEPVRLARKSVETLLALVEHPGQVLTKDELIQAIWQGRVVDEANLVQNIAVIRRTLGIEAGQPGYIETFPGRGYRMMGPIVEESEELPVPQRIAPPGPEERKPDGEPPPAGKSDLQPVASARWLRAGGAALLVLLCAAVFAWRWHRSTGEDRSFRRTAVARLGGKEMQPAVSADGRGEAFVLERDDRRPNRISVRPAPDAHWFFLSREGWEYSSPAWSPDGKQLAFLRFGDREGQVVITPAQPNGPERVVATVFRTRFGLPHRHLDWSPDGTMLAVDDTSAAEAPFAIELISVLTGERRRLTNPPASVLGDVDPSFSPDGRSVSFIRVFHRARQGLFSIAADGKDERQLSRDIFQISGQDWTADGKALVMGSNRSGDFRLWRVRLDRPLEAVPDWTGTYGDAAIQLTLARRAPVLEYSVLQEDFNIWRLDLGSGGGAGRWTRVVNSSAQDVSPQYSPDAAEILFRSDRTGEDQLWVAAADGSNPRQVTTGARRPSVGRWSADGSAIVFNDSKEMDLYIARRGASGRWETRAVGTKGLHPVFSADGKWLYAGLQNAILRIDPATGKADKIAATKGLSFGLSPDGRALYFVRELTSSTLWQLELESGAISKLLDGLVPYCSSCWAAGPRGVYYLGAKRSGVNGQAIYLHAGATVPDKLVAEYPEPLLPLGSGPFSISSDGRYLLCVRVDPSNADVMRIEPYR